MNPVYAAHDVYESTQDVPLYLHVDLCAGQFIELGDVTESTEHTLDVHVVYDASSNQHFSLDCVYTSLHAAYVNEVYAVHVVYIDTHDVPLKVQEIKKLLQLVAETDTVLGASAHVLTLHYPGTPESGAHIP